MEYYEVLIIAHNPEKIFVLGSFAIEILQNINEGAKPIKGGQGNQLLGFFGGKTNYSFKIFDSAQEAKNKGIPIKNLNVVLTKPDLKIQINGASLKFENDNIVIESDEFLKIRL